jgi:UDPglucose--hexose-1-phosphate uridylyltransferase
MPNQTSNEMRYNPVSGEWVIYATARRSRPDEMQPRSSSCIADSRYEPTCPFCPGNETLLPGILMELGNGSGGWSVRVVPNRYPALTASGFSSETLHGIYRSMRGNGRHEVVIESPFHDHHLGSLAPADAEAVVEAYHRRYLELASRPGVQTVFIFRNHGIKAGTSLAHPHSQIISMSLVPQAVQVRRKRSTAHFSISNRCLLCHLLKEEAEDGRRTLFQNDHFIGFVPYAAEVPCEIWIVPKAHCPDFGNISENEKSGLAEGLQLSLGRLNEKLNNPDYNFVFHSAFRRDEGAANALHWYVQIQPHLTTPAGFEMGSGIRINPCLPEIDAARLRGDKG